MLFGIELECAWSEQPTFEQIDSCAEEIVFRARQYQWRWPFVIEGHYGVALPQGRRSDPWLLDWGSFMGRLFVRSQAGLIPGLA